MSEMHVSRQRGSTGLPVSGDGFDDVLVPLIDQITRSRVIAASCVLLGALASGVATYAIVQRLLDPVRGVYLITITDAFVLSAWLFVRSMEREERIELQSHWGGLGGGLGGWRLSRSLVFLGTTAVTFILLANAITGERRIDLRERYRAALNVAARNNIRCDDRGIVEGRLVLRCDPGGRTKEQAKAAYDKFWDQIKLANPAYDDIVVTLPSPPAPAAPPVQQTTAAAK
jgi:hypothetical protein